METVTALLSMVVPERHRDLLQGRLRVLFGDSTLDIQNLQSVFANASLCTTNSELISTDEYIATVMEVCICIMLCI